MSQSTERESTDRVREEGYPEAAGATLHNGEVSGL